MKRFMYAPPVAEDLHFLLPGLLCQSGGDDYVSGGNEDLTFEEFEL